MIADQAEAASAVAIVDDVVQSHELEDPCQITQSDGRPTRTHAYRSGPIDRNILLAVSQDRAGTGRKRPLAALNIVGCQLERSTNKEHSSRRQVKWWRSFHSATMFHLIAFILFLIVVASILFMIWVELIRMVIETLPVCIVVGIHTVTSIIIGCSAHVFSFICCKA